MEKKKILKMEAIIVGVAVFLFLLVQINEALDNRQMRLGIEKDRKERQEKKKQRRLLRNTWIHLRKIWNFISALQ
jgi:hypothetical protein